MIELLNLEQVQYFKIKLKLHSTTCEKYIHCFFILSLQNIARFSGFFRIPWSTSLLTFFIQRPTGKKLNPPLSEIVLKKMFTETFQLDFKKIQKLCFDH